MTTPSAAVAPVMLMVLPLIFRPPMGFKTWHIAAAAREARLPMIAWSLRGCDTRANSGKELAGRVLRKISGHDIVMLQDGIAPQRGAASGNRAARGGEIVQALPEILAGIRAKKLEIVPLVEALVAAAQWQKEAAGRLVAREGGTV